MKFIRNLLILLFILAILFIAIGISGEGDKFRLLGAKFGGAAELIGNKLAVEADSLRKKALEYKKRFSGYIERVPDDVKEPAKKK